MTERFPEIALAGRVARRHRARRRDRSSGKDRSGRRRSPCCSSASAAKTADARRCSPTRRSASSPTTCSKTRRRRPRASCRRPSGARRGSRHSDADSRRSASRRVETAELGALTPSCATQSRARGVEGFMLKHRARALRHRPRKQDDLGGTVVEVEDRSDQRSTACSSMRRPATAAARSVYTDYTFAVVEPAASRRDAAASRGRRDRGRSPRDSEPPGAAPDALAAGRRSPRRYSGLTDEEFKRSRPRDPRAPRSRSSARCAAVRPSAGVRARLRRHQAQQPPQRAASRCAFRACCASATTSRCTMDTMACSRPCWRCSRAPHRPSVPGAEE